MKKYLLFLGLAAFGMNAQTTQTINSQLKLVTVPTVTSTDEVLVTNSAGDKIVKKITTANLFAGITPPAPTLQAVTTTGDTSTNPVHLDGGLDVTWANGHFSAGLNTPLANQRELSFETTGNGTDADADKSTSFIFTPESVDIAFNNSTTDIVNDLFLSNNGSTLRTIDSGTTSGLRTTSAKALLECTDSNFSSSIETTVNVIDLLEVQTDGKASRIFMTGSSISIQTQNPIDSIDSSLVTNDDGFSFNNYNPTSRGLFSSLDYTANITDLDYPQELYVIPRSGTKIGKPITGNLEVRGDNDTYKIFKHNIGEDVDMSLSFQDTFMLLEAFSVSTPSINSRIQMMPGSINFVSNTAQIDFNETRGLQANNDFSDNIEEFDYTQKPYVDRNLLTIYTVATLPASPTEGQQAWVTDATAPTYLGTLTGGGAVKCPVVYNGSTWVTH